MKVFRISLVNIVGISALCLFCLCAAALYTTYPVVQRGGINPLNQKVKLLPKADANVGAVGYLKPGEFATYITSGSTQKWHYVRFKEKELVIYHKKFQLGFYRYADFIFSKQQTLEAMFVSGGVFIVYLLLLVVWLLRGIVRLFRKPPVRQEAQTTPRQRVVRVTPSPQPAIDINRIKKEAYQEGQLDGVQLGERRAAHKHNQALVASQQRAQREAEREIVIVKASLEKNLKQEFKREREASIREMKASYDALNLEYNGAIEKAKVFDVDIHDKDFDKLLKGRLFEICIAEMLTKDNDFKLLEWTPDKGFGKKIFVAANLHPDLVFENRNGDQFAVECKYRGGFDTFRVDRYSDAVSWCKTKSFSNYQRFARTRNINVWVALGVSGDPNRPDLLAFSPAHILANKSKPVFSKTKDIDEQLACKRQVLQSWLVPYGHRFNQRGFLDDLELVIQDAPRPESERGLAS